MAVFTFFESSYSATGFVDSNANGDSVVVAAGVTLITDSGTDPAIELDGDFSSSTVLGNIWANGGSGGYRSSGDNVSLHVGSEGSVIWKSTTASQINGAAFTGSNVTLTNDGTITGGRGVALFGTGQSVINNTGTISAAGQNGLEAGAILINSPIGSSVINDVLISNSGQILGQLGNSGDPFADNFVAINADREDRETRVEVLNTGEIFGRIALNLNDDQIFNSGTISGRIDMGEGADTVTNSGQINGSVYLELGNDTYDGDADGSVSGTVYGMGGNDILLGTRADDRFDGGSSNDILRGHAGDDYLRGRIGEDQMFGGDGNDELIGDEYDDRLDGGSGNDLLDGGADNDILRAGSGDDTLTGGTGRDVMFSGSGEDRFVFESTSDSAVGSLRDAIRDFERGADVIDLEDLVAGTISYRGTSGFTGSGPELRHVTTAAGSSVVQIDTDGNGVRDMEILVQFTPTMSESDFLL